MSNGIRGFEQGFGGRIGKLDATFDISDQHAVGHLLKDSRQPGSFVIQGRGSFPLRHGQSLDRVGESFQSPLVFRQVGQGKTIIDSTADRAGKGIQPAPQVKIAPAQPEQRS